jgi:hypothetical protein
MAVLLYWNIMSGGQAGLNFDLKNEHNLGTLVNFCDMGRVK